MPNKTPHGGARRGSGRKPVLTRLVQIRLSPEDFTRLSEIAGMAGTKPATLARKLIIERLDAATAR